MRHYNSPEELAKRQGQPEAAPTRQGFRHYNHPEEVAKREGRSTAVVVPPRRVIEAQGWPPPGQDNTASVEVRENDAPPSEPPSSADLPLERLERLEQVLFALVRDKGEAREFRVRLSSLDSVIDSQRTLGNRLLQLEQLLPAVDDDDDDDDEPEGGTQPPPGDVGATQPPTEST